MTTEAREIALVRACCRGDREAFGELVRMQEGRIFNLALRLLGDREDAEDAVQETFLRAYAGLRGWRRKGAFGAWLYRIGLNVCRDLARRRGKRGSIVFSPPEELAGEGASGVGRSGPATSTLAAAESLEKDELKRHVQDALASLPEHYRSTLIMFELHGLSYEQIGLITGAPVGTVRSRLNRARLMFKDQMKKWVSLG